MVGQDKGFAHKIDEFGEFLRDLCNGGTSAKEGAAGTIQNSNQEKLVYHQPQPSTRRNYTPSISSWSPRTSPCDLVHINLSQYREDVELCAVSHPSAHQARLRQSTRAGIEESRILEGEGVRAWVRACRNVLIRQTVVYAHERAICDIKYDKNSRPRSIFVFSHRASPRPRPRPRPPSQGSQSA